MSSSRILKSDRLIILLLAVLLIFTIASTSINSISPTDLGLVSRLPIAFWIGLALLGCLWYFCSRGSTKYQIVALGFTVLYLYFAPAVIRIPVWISESYYPFGESVLINSYGHLVTPTFAREVLGVERAFPLMSYQYWPVFLYLASAFTLVTGMPHSMILKYFPLLTISLYGLLTFLILRVKLKASYATFGAAWFLSSFFLRQQYFGPQGIAYIFFLLIVLIVSQLFFDKETKKGTFTALFLFLFIVITLTHALTAFITLTVVVAAYLAHRFLYKRPQAIASGLCMFSAVFLLAYNLTIAPGFFDLSVRTLSQFFLGIWEFSLFREPSRVVGSEAQRLSYAVSWGIVLLTGLIAAIQVLYVLNRVRSRKQKTKEDFSFFMVIWLVVVAVFAVTAVYGSHEAYQRAFMFGLIPITYLCVSLLSKRPWVLILLLGGLLFLNIPAQYGSDTYRLATDEVLAGTGYFVHYTPQNTTVLYGFYPHIRYHDPMKIVGFVEVRGTLPFTSVPNLTAVRKAVTSADYIIRSDLQRNYYLYFFREDPLDQISFDSFNRVYDSESFHIFSHANRTSLP